MEDKYIGKQFGCYKIVDIFITKDNDGHKLYLGKCIECGHIRIARISDFKNKYIRHSEHKLKIKFWDSVRVCHIFYDMIDRCYNKNNKSYNIYGKKGIKVCSEWLINPKYFNDWSLKHGYNDNLTIDRIDPNKNYCPENCRWITKEENSKWKSTTNYIEVNGILDSGRGWAKRLGFGQNYINKYLNNNGIEQTTSFIKSYL